MADLMETFFPFAVLLTLLLSLLAFGIWLWALIDCAVNESSEGNTKIVWVLIIVFTNWIGAILYLLVRRPQRLREERESRTSVLPPGHGSRSDTDSRPPPPAPPIGH